MKSFFILSAGALIFLFASCKTQSTIGKNDIGKNNPSSDSGKKSPELYRASYSKINDLVHTKLELVPDWKLKVINGKATITLHPHFYPTDSLLLNARGMDLHEVSRLSDDGKHIPLSYTYINDKIHIRLDTFLTRIQNYRIYIDYTSNPEKLKAGGSSAIASDKGFYFINADGKDPDRPRQFWTQGETESNSVWFPTIEAPNQKMTQEIYLTVDSSYRSLSNGLLLSSKFNSDGTRTDYWKQSLPAAPYLSMVASGDFAVVKDRWRNIELSYYVDKPYEKYARMIFGRTPAIMDFFSTLLKVDFQWEKYAQVVVHDFVSGAMENTTAVVHGLYLQQDSSEYMDENYERVIAHELFHHWFGDLVTCESWANMTLNEGFANYAQYLWEEHLSGRDEADVYNQLELEYYFYAADQIDPPLLRYQYDSREDVYDAISYQKGGRVLHMLRKYIGDEAFFLALHNYLIEHKFSTVEMADLRLAFEEVTGEDLNWFFNQWFIRNGYPKVNISCSWDDGTRKETIHLEQTQDMKINPPFRIPLDVDVYFNGKKERKRIEMTNAVQDFVIDIPTKPELVNIDAEKMMCWKKKEKKSNEEWMFQYYNAPLYLDRLEAMNSIVPSYDTHSKESKMIIDALSDSSWSIRELALEKISIITSNAPDTMKPILISIARNDLNSSVREEALKSLSQNYKFADLSDEFHHALKDRSYKVVARAFKIISEKNPKTAMNIAEKLEVDSGEEVMSALAGFYAENNSVDKNQFYMHAIRSSNSWVRYSILKDYGEYLAAHEDSILDEGINLLGDYGKLTSSHRLREYIIARLATIQSELLSKVEAKKGSQSRGNPNSKENSNPPVDTTRLMEQSAHISAVIESLKKLNEG